MRKRGRPRHPDILTPREWEVIGLIREELSNEEIAGRLDVSLDGAKYHVSEILAKLGLENRSDAAKWTPGEEQPWWWAALGPLFFWRRLRPSWLSPAVAGGLGIALAAGIGLLVWGILQTGGQDGSPSGDDSALVALETAAPCILPTGLASDSRNSFAEAPSVEGAGAVQLLTTREAVQARSPEHLVRWCDEAGRVQEQELSSDTNISGLACFDCAFLAANQQARDGERELGVVYDTASLGSGSPQLAYALLRLEDSAWRVVWDSTDAPAWRGSHGHAQFTNADLSELRVESDSWASGSDALSGVLHEANAGPHRYFIDVWVRAGDGYTLRSESTVPSPYATLVEFLDALNGDHVARAEQLVSNAELVSEARQLGLAGAAGWLVLCDSGLECGKADPIVFDPQGEHGEPSAALSFDQASDGRWLISAIVVCPRVRLARPSTHRVGPCNFDPEV